MALLVKGPVVLGSPVAVIRGHVGAAGKGHAVVWVEEVLEGPLIEGGVIEVLWSDPGPEIDRVRVGDLVEVRGLVVTKGCRKVIVLDSSDHHLRRLGDALEAGVRLSVGCGGRIEEGSNITYIFFVSGDSNVTLTESTGGGGNRVIFSGRLRAGIYSLTGRAEGRGERRVCVLAESGGDSVLGCCEYTVVPRRGEAGGGTGAQGNLTIRVLTEAGYPVRNASVYIDGVLYGHTDRRGILETNISEGVHEVRVESEYYRTAITESGPGLVVLRVGVKAPEVTLSFSPERINGSGVVKLVVRRLGGADISIRVRLTPFGDLNVNTTEVIGVPPFNVTLEVRGEGKLVASYGKITAVLSSEVKRKPVREAHDTVSGKIVRTSLYHSSTIAETTVKKSVKPPYSFSSAIRTSRGIEAYWWLLIILVLLVGLIVIRWIVIKEDLPRWMIHNYEDERYP